MTQAGQPGTRPLLSFAIPTYNRAKYLEQLLQVLLTQVAGDVRVEIIVSDNASTDQTSQVIAHFRAQGLEIRHFRNETNLGPDGNILQCYEKASGKYVWVFGDDDLPLPGALATVLRLLQEQELDLLFLAPQVFLNSTAEIVPPKRIVPSEISTDPIRLATLANLHADLIFISAVIVNADYVASLPHPPFSALLGTNLVQLGWVFTALRHLRRGAFVQVGLLAAKAGNSSGGFAAENVFGKNFRDAVSLTLDPDSKLAAKLLDDHLLIWFSRNWLSFRHTRSDRQAAQVFTKAFGTRPRFWLCAYPILRAPRRFAALWARMLHIGLRLKLDRLKTSPAKSEIS